MQTAIAWTHEPEESDADGHLIRVSYAADERHANYPVENTNKSNYL
jgi:hypothetical protein